MKFNVKFKLSVGEFRELFDYFKNGGYQNFGPFLKNGAIDIGEIDSFESFPRGIYEDLDKGVYRIENKDDGSFFQYTVGPSSFKPFLHPKRRRLFTAERADGNIKISAEEEIPVPKVFWGIRSCDLYSILVLDEVFKTGKYRNKSYKTHRKDNFFISVNCTRPSKNCLCTSVGTGPKARQGYDLSITEVFDEDDHFFICTTGSPEAERICKELNFTQSETFDLHRADALVEEAARSINTVFDAREAREILNSSYEEKHWLSLEERCLACGNCTMVCPTCFCTTTEDLTNLDANRTEKWVKWDSCFNGDYSYIHGGMVRKTIKSRYRQWITHKLSTWHEQFNTTGCVGCGRCITWCPVGIDIREEIKSLESRKNDRVKSQNN